MCFKNLGTSTRTTREKGGHQIYRLGGTFKSPENAIQQIGRREFKALPDWELRL